MLIACSIANLSSSSWSPPSRRPSTVCAQDQLESLIARHGHPTRVSLSSLEELTATSSTYNPPSSASRSPSPLSDTTDSLETLSLSTSTSRPIPIPKPSFHTHQDDLPVTPLTGRFDKGYYFAHRDQAYFKTREKPTHRRSRPHAHCSSRSPASMRSDSSTFYSPVVSSSMSPSARPSSPQQPPRSRAQNPTKSVPAFHLNNLPRFHPAVYSAGSQGQPTSPRQLRPSAYRTTSGSRDAMWQYQELVEGVTLSKTPSRPLSPSPSAPRLDPLRSPGPVTPLALEEASGYLISGTSNASAFTSRDAHSGPAPDLIDRLIVREAERARQNTKKGTKTRC
ncbi:hypothetical protein ABOM_003819 [Aspergillus bombycis]|uniref:Uncharacterized protein n=1 Tax=Aspergillus bombycis TaxID=109264 RepID=A0A1F8A6L2_9EURO|nr:hypothetical protein ABOM_003819 [Aspergillus bombycis]OGM47361.1 hypothetical protein ABOM_003819 [Aspergillus bombycis]